MLLYLTQRSWIPGQIIPQNRPVAREFVQPSSTLAKIVPRHSTRLVAHRHPDHNPPRMRSTLPAVLLLILARPVLGSVELSLPLEGYYRPGRYMPLRVQVTAEAAEHLIIAADHALPSRVELTHGRAEGVTPFLPLSAGLRQLRWHITGGAYGTVQPAMRMLAPDQKLVAFTTVDLTFATLLFPDATIIPIRLDAATPLPGHTAAWQTLDAVVLDQAAAIQLDDTKLAALLAGGTAIAVRTHLPPTNWPWTQVGDYQVLSHQPAGPPWAGVNAPAFAPVQGWEADWPIRFRTRVVLYAVFFAIGILALTLMRSRWAGAIGAAISALTVVLLALWWQGRAAVLERAGQLIVVDAKLTQVDAWTYLASASPTNTTIAWSQLMHPVFEDDAARDAIALSLTCASDGQPRFLAGRLLPGVRIACFSRSIQPRPLLKTAPAPDNAPLARLARRVYLRPGDRIAGQVTSTARQKPDTVERWPTLVIHRAPPQPPTTQP